MKKLSPTTLRLLNAFDDAAQSHGYLSDQGSRESAARAERAWLDARDRLERHLLKMFKREKSK